MRLFIIFIVLMSNSFANEIIDIKNLVINKELKKYDTLTFLDAKNKQINSFFLHSFIIKFDQYL